MMKRIFSIFAILILVAMYGITLVFALIDNPQTYQYLKISIGLTILIPVLLWIYLAMFKYIQQHKQNADTNSKKEDFH